MMNKYHRILNLWRRYSLKYDHTMLGILLAYSYGALLVPPRTGRMVGMLLDIRLELLLTGPIHDRTVEAKNTIH